MRAQKQQQARQQAEQRRQQVLDRKVQRDTKVAARAAAVAQAQRPLSPASLASRTRQRWLASGIMSLRGLDLTALPDVAQDLAELGEARTRIYAKSCATSRRWQQSSSQLARRVALLLRPGHLRHCSASATLSAETVLAHRSQMTA